MTNKDAWPRSAPKDDLFGGFSFVASSSLLNNDAFAAFAQT
jgi:hypothetical protein